MKVLTLTSVILLPGALIAGVMGMNFKVGVFEDSSMFYIVVALILALAPLTVAIARMRAGSSCRPSLDLHGAS
jgi:Mg2+ and Co2+ transporter CorA